ncbi:hypothetical protein GCM10010409_39540 [Mycolicibacterium diernhoferi]
MPSLPDSRLGAFTADTISGVVVSVVVGSVTGADCPPAAGPPHPVRATAHAKITERSILMR